MKRNNPIPAYTRKGAVLYQGDCLSVLSSLADKSVDGVVTDPPYNVGIQYSEYDDNRSDYAEWCGKWFAELRRVSRGAITISCGHANVCVWARICPPDWWLAWHKPSAMGRCIAGFNNWEPIALYGKPAKATCDVIRATIRPDKSVKGHPCPKPVEWAIRQLEMLIPSGGTVLDPFSGSGTTGVAALRYGYQFVGIEIDAKYVAIAKGRLDKCVARPMGFMT